MSVLATDAVRESRIRALLDELIRQRRRLENSSDDRGLLEANRLSIVYWQWQLARCRSGEEPRGGRAA
jgi:hypothetical protein